ncbi:hypothetical protein KAR91_57385 [Candidatus Pacearchaeota archaeon]|nr:hypothetical protein [Candidatus Pacearchaeota archaeon]
MKKFIVFLIIAMLTVSVFGASAFDIKWWSQQTYSNLPGNTLRLWAESIDSRAGDTYYVDGNKVTAGDGSSWNEAFNTLSAAMAASHADIAVSADRQWAARNTIYVRADGITEDLTTMAQKTDIIGVGSNDAYSKALIVGTWIIPDTTAYPGCRFYNMIFRDDGAGGALFDIDTQAGLEFHGCIFSANATDTIALQVEECQTLVVNECEFSDLGSNGGFTESAIKVVDDTDAVWNYKITNNYIRSDGIGIDFDETASEGCVASGNTFDVTGRWIDDEGDDLIVTNNNAITAVDTGTVTDGYDFNLAKAAGNIQTGSGGETDLIPLDDTASASNTDTAAILVDTTAIEVDTAYMQPLAEGAASKVLTTIMSGNNDIFVVAGGPVKIIELIGIVTTELEAKGNLINYNMDPTSPAGDTVFGTDGTALEVTGDTVGTIYTWDGTIANDLIATTNGVYYGTPYQLDGGAVLTGNLVVPVGSLEFASVVATSATGEITFYIRYTPLVSGATVTAAP